MQREMLSVASQLYCRKQYAVLWCESCFKVKVQVNIVPFEYKAIKCNRTPFNFVAVKNMLFSGVIIPIDFFKGAYLANHNLV